MDDINRHSEETSTTGRGTLSHHATHAHSDGQYSLHYTHGWSHVTRSYPTYAPGPLSSHYTSSSSPDHPYSYQHGTPSPPIHALPAQHGIIPSSSHHFTPSPPADGHPHDHGFRPSSSHHATPSPSAHPAHSPGVGDEHTSTSRRPPTPHRHSSARSCSNRLRSSIPNAIEELPGFFDLRRPLRKAKTLLFISLLSMASIQYTGNLYLIAKKRITHIYLTDEVFEHYKRMRATDEAFKKKSEQMSMNKKSEVGGPGTGISLHSAGSISARQHSDTLEKKLQRSPTRKEMFRHLHTHDHDSQTFVDQRSAKIDVELTGRLEEMSTQTPDTSIDEDVVYLEVVPEVKGRVYGLGSQGYHRNIFLGEASSSRGRTYGLNELEELQRDHQRPHVPPTPRTPPSAVTERSGPQSDDQPGHLMTEISPSQTAPPDDHQPEHWSDPHRRMPEDQRHLLDDHDEFMS
ncbi:hypothetical protein Syun_023687 [Stephania yunnanensis]|uniref:Uncharacterized protein n=1 Tax=Stephania yunnanensis TaxID=152371 RepID=A0AAP0F9G3_9MAGN